MQTTDPENALTQVSSVESTSSNSSDSSKLESKPDYVAAGKGKGGELFFGKNSLTIGGGTGEGAEMTWEEILYLRKTAGEVTIGGGVGLGAKLHGVRAGMEKDAALEKKELKN